MPDDPKTIALSEVGEVLDRIYASECPVRLEFVYDGGWTWTVIGHNKGDEIGWPRVWIDNNIQGNQRVMVMTDAARTVMETIHEQKKDWLHRGTGKPINEAVHAMASALYLEIPDSDFGRWWSEKIAADVR